MTDLNKLDREVAEVLGLNIVDKPTAFIWIQDSVGTRRFHPSTNPAQAMELLKQYKISINYRSGIPSQDKIWAAILYVSGESFLASGPTPEVSICKAVVAAKNT